MVYGNIYVYEQNCANKNVREVRERLKILYFTHVHVLFSSVTPFFCMA